MQSYTTYGMLFDRELDFEIKYGRVSTSLKTVLPDVLSK